MIEAKKISLRSDRTNVKTSNFNFKHIIYYEPQYSTKGIYKGYSLIINKQDLAFKVLTIIVPI